MTNPDNRDPMDRRRANTDAATSPEPLPLATDMPRITLPLVHCRKPGGVHLTSKRIGETLNAEDAAPHTNDVTKSQATATYARRR
jgi:hypothetical protein